MAQRGAWMSLEEIERMERRLRRLLETPVAPAPKRPAKPTGAAPDSSQRRARALPDEEDS